MSQRAWLCALFGINLAALIFGAVVFDVDQVEHARQTISNWSLHFGQKYGWYPFLLTAFGAASVMALATHLWLPRQGDAHCFGWSVAGALCGALVGVILSMYFFLQPGN